MLISHIQCWNWVLILVPSLILFDTLYGEDTLTIYGMKSVSITEYATICSGAFSNCAPYGWDDNGKYNWTQRATTSNGGAVFYALDEDTKTIYALDKDESGYYYIYKIFIDESETNGTYQGEWKTETIYSCTSSTTACQLSGYSTYYQAVAFDKETQTFWWIGSDESSSTTIGFYQLYVENGTRIFHDWCSTAWGGLKRQIGQMQIYNGYLYVVERLKDGIVRYNIDGNDDSDDGNRTIIVSLDDYNFTTGQGVYASPCVICLL